MTTQIKEKDLVAEKLEAEAAEVEARLKVIQAQAEAQKAKEDMDRISGLSAAKDKVKKEIADIKRQAKMDYTATKLAVEGELKELKAGIERMGARYKTWDAASERWFSARLDQAEAQLKVWKAQAREKKAEQDMKRHDALASLEEKIALARARAAEVRHEKYSAKAQVALDDASRHFDEAFDAAAKRYGMA